MTKKTAFELQDVIETIGIHCDKAKAVLWQVTEDYFGEGTPNARHLMYYYQMYSLLLVIVHDYLGEIEKLVEEVVGGEE